MNAFLFIPLLGFTWAFGFALATVTSHYFLVVLEGSAAGNEEIVLPDEPITDWCWKGFYLAVISIVWCAAGFFAAWAAGRGHPALQVALIIGWTWLLFPIGILSSMSASSRWVPFWPGLFARMAQRTSKVFWFYVISLPALTIFGVGFYLMTVRSGLDLVEIIFLAPIAAGALLIYARLLGRLGLVLTFTKGPRKSTSKERRKEARPQRPAMVIPELEELPAGPTQPSQMPGIMSPMEGEVTGYDVKFDDPPPLPEPAPAAVRQRVDNDDDSEPMRFADPEREPDQERVPSPQEEKALHPPSRLELELFDHSDRIVKEPKQPFGLTCISFLVQSGPFSAWVRLSMGFMLMGVLIMSLRALRPI